MECYDSLWNVTIACGVLLLLVECYYCLWNVTIVCGMLLLLVECYDSLWNVTVCYLSVRDATPTGLAPPPPPPLNENLLKSTKI